MKQKTVLLLAVFAMAAPLTSAYAATGFGPGLFPGGPGDPALMLEHMADHLDLTDEQRDSVENILQAAKPEIEAIRDQARANREAIQALQVVLLVSLLVWRPIFRPITWAKWSMPAWP